MTEAAKAHRAVIVAVTTAHSAAAEAAASPPTLTLVWLRPARLRDLLSSCPLQRCARPPLCVNGPLLQAGLSANCPALIAAVCSICPRSLSLPVLVLQVRVEAKPQGSGQGKVVGVSPCRPNLAPLPQRVTCRKARNPRGRPTSLPVPVLPVRVVEWSHALRHPTSPRPERVERPNRLLLGATPSNPAWRG